MKQKRDIEQFIRQIRDVAVKRLADGAVASDVELGLIRAGLHADVAKFLVNQELLKNAKIVSDLISQGNLPLAEIKLRAIIKCSATSEGVELGNSQEIKYLPWWAVNRPQPQ